MYKGGTMKVAVSAQGKDMNAPIDPRMGRAQQFLIIDMESMAYEVLDNPNVGAMGGAGIQTAQLLASNGVQAVITGNCGPNAFTTLHTAGIQIYIGASGTIQQVLEQYKNGQLQLANQANVGGHFGDPRGTGGRGRGRGSGRGQGPGRQGM
jgi:predicted Fe-Mo cluster-binding NifX family protein